MAKTVPKSLSDAIEEDPGRFINYLDLNRIAKSPNPYKEFLIQFQNKFDSVNGLNLWQYLVKKYKLFNIMFKSKEIQKKLPEQFKGSLSRKESQTYFNEYLEKTTKSQKKRDVKIKKPVEVKNYKRAGKTIKGYKKSKPSKYSKRMERFILSRKNYPVSQLADEFNRYFNETVTKYGIRDKRLRLLGRKE